MNKIVEQSEADLKRSISKMSFDELNSLLRLINREISLTQQELKRSFNLLEISKEKRNNLDIFRYEQNIRDVDLELEKLDRKKNICEVQIDSMNAKTSSSVNTSSKVYNGSSAVSNKSSSLDATSKVSNGLSKSTDFSENFDSTSKLTNIPAESDNIRQSQEIDESNKICLSTKLLISNFEKMNSITSPSSAASNENKSLSRVKEQRTPDSAISLQKNMKPKLENQDNNSNEPFFNKVKLKKVGLPLDAQEFDQSTLVKICSDRRDSVEKKSQGLIVTPYVSKSRSSSIDIIRSTETPSKDKFYNPNKEIQVAIQNEIKEIRLKKIELNSPPLNVDVEQVNMGKFNFSNEKSISGSNSTSTPMSASKSMPFLNRLASTNTVFEDSFEDSSNVEQFEENIRLPNEDNLNLNSILKDWNPMEALKKLYTIHRKSTESRSTKVNKFSAYVDMIIGSSIGKSWLRKYICILNGHLHFYANDTSFTPTDTLDLRHINVKSAHNDSVELYDSKGIHSTLRCLKSSDCQQLVASLEFARININNEMIPYLYDDIKDAHSRKVLVVDMGSCSVRAGILKIESTLPGLYFPHIAALSKVTDDAVEVGFEVFDPKITETCHIIRPLKPDTTLEHIAFTSGIVELTISKICTTLQINPKEYIIMLSLPYNVAESTRSKLADVLFLRLNFKGISMCGESLLALHAYGEPTGLLIDIGYRTEVLPVTHGLVQTIAVKRSLLGGHLMQVALSHLLPFELHSITDSLFVRLIMEQTCYIAKNSEEAHKNSECANVDLQRYNLPSVIQNPLTIQGKDRCLPIEGLFNPEIYSIDTIGICEIIKKSVQSCPMDLRKDLYQSIYLSGAATQFNGLLERLEFELRKDLSNQCEVKVHAAPDRAHFSYVGACYVASSERFMSTVVSRLDWEDSRISSLKKWHF